MSIAAINSLIVALIGEKGSLEFQRTVIDQRRQTLALHSAFLYEELSAELLKQDEEGEDAIDDDSFMKEYNAATAQIENQDKFLEMQRTNLQTKLDAITTSLESAEKRLNKNIENDMKGMGS